MKLHEASAVFLIIGGVLLGPIEGKETWGSTGLCSCDLGDRPGPLCPIKEELDGSQCHVQRETTAETCARAMREVGAEKTWNSWFITVPDSPRSIRVLCIPAPSGLAKQ